MCTRSESTGSRCALVYKSCNHGFGALDGRGHADDLKAIAAPPHLDTEPRLDLMQVLIERSAQLDQSDIVRRSEDQIARHGHRTHE
jgi:hypothetical protein